MPLQFCPMPYRYAAVRMDPVAMVKHLQDPLALAAARAMQCKTHLVYVDSDLELPFPGKPWYRFCLCPIGTSLRPEDKEKGFTPDMCIPIHPNQRHPLDRPALRPEPAFPFDNCYHWINFAIYARVRARAEGFEDDHAIRLSVAQRWDMEGYWGEDDARNARTPEDLFAQDSDASSLASDSGSLSVSFMDEVTEDGAARDSCGDLLRQLNLFGDPTHDIELFPLVDLWFEITDHLNQEDIPDPMEIFKERDEIVKIIEEARARANTALNRSLLQLNATRHMPEGLEEALDADTAEKIPQQSFAKLLRKHRRRCYLFLRRLRYLFRPPYVAVWP